MGFSGFLRVFSEILVGSVNSVFSEVFVDIFWLFVVLICRGFFVGFLCFFVGVSCFFVCWVGVVGFFVCMWWYFVVVYGFREVSWVFAFFLWCLRCFLDFVRFFSWVCSFL